MKKSVVMLLLCSLQAFAINLALNKPASALYSYGGLPGNAVDGKLNTEWNAGGPGTVSLPLWVMIDLQSICSVDRISLWDETDGIDIGKSNIYNLYSSLNMTQWELLGRGTLYDTSDPYDVFLLNAKKMRYVKYEVVGGTHWAHICEIEVYGIPEPCTLLLLGLGGIILRKRRTK